jgi:glycosyltransferase involved in cell wall biosynthesis
MFSVIIPAKNEALNISRCINSIYKSTKNQGKVEIIVIDNGSTDKTVAIAKSKGAIVFTDKTANVSGLRNLGASKASHNIIAFIDADCEALPGWLENANKTLSESKVGLTGDFCLVPETHGWIENSLYAKVERQKRNVAYLGSANMVTKSDIFFHVGGFDTNALTGEDYIFCVKLKKYGYRVVADPAVSVIHYGYPKTLKQLFHREIWHGMGMVDLYRNGKLTLPLVWAIINAIILLALIPVLYAKWVQVALISFGLVFILPFLAAYKKCLDQKTFKSYLKLVVIFAIYGTARTISIFKLVLRRN